MATSDSKGATDTDRISTSTPNTPPSITPLNILTNTNSNNTNMNNQDEDRMVTNVEIHTTSDKELSEIQETPSNVWNSQKPFFFL